MNWDWEMIRTQAKIVFAKIAQLILFEIACVYLLAFAVAQRPIGPRGFVDFLHHTFEWRDAKDGAKHPPQVRPAGVVSHE